MTITFRVKWAFGADLTANSASWSFTDLTSRTLGELTIQVGSLDEAANTTPAACSFRMRNTDGWMTPHNPASLYYPNVRRQTPVTIEINPGTGFTQVFEGFIDEITPDWPAGNSNYAEVSVTASGVMRRLTQGSPSLQSAIYRSTTAAAGLVTYAPMEEDSGAATINITGGKSRNALFGGTVTFAGDTTLGGAKQAIVLNSTSYLALNSQGHTFSGQWQIDWFMKFTGSAPAAETIVMRGYTDNPNAMFVDAVYGGVPNWGVRVYDKFGTAVGSSIFSPPTGQASGWWHWRLMAHDGGAGGTDYQLVTFPVLDAGGSFAPLTVAGVTPGNLTACAKAPAVAFDGVAMAHWAIYDRFNFSAVDGSGDGYAGESPTTRLARLGAESGIEITVTGTSAVTMGPQKPNTVLTLMRECEAADGGILSDGFTAGLSYLAESSRYNRAATLALDLDRSQVKLPFTPTEDDQRITNDITVTGNDGSRAQFVDEDSVAANGRYESSVTVNLEAAELADDASWRVHLGVVDEMRVPQLTLQLIDRPELWSSALALRPGHRITVINMLDQYPPGTLDLMCEGFTHTIDAVSWRMDINCSPASPWTVGLLDTEYGDCGASVLGTVLPTAAIGSSTTMDVLVSDGCDWSHADGDVSITLGGEEMTLTAVGATTTPTPALVAVGTAGTGNASAVTPGLPGGATAVGNLLLMLASVRDTNAVATDMYVTGTTGWQKLFDGINMSLFAKVHNGAEVAPTVNYIAGIAGDTVIAQIASFTGKWGDPASQTVALAQQVNAAAQDIGYPSLNVPIGGVLLVWMGWKADDWTSVATLGGITEISEATSTLGNDAGIVWDYNTSAGIPSVGGGSFVVTGGTSQISRSALIAIRSVYQTVTVTRGVNGLTRAHPVGEPVHVTHPLILTRQ